MGGGCAWKDLSAAAASVAVVTNRRSSEAVTPIVAKPRSGGDAECGTNLLFEGKFGKVGGHLGPNEPSDETYTQKIVRSSGSNETMQSVLASTVFSRSEATL